MKLLVKMFVNDQTSECHFRRLNLQCFQTVCIVVGRSGARADEGVGPSTFGHLLASSRDLARA